MPQVTGTFGGVGGGLRRDNSYKNIRHQFKKRKQTLDPAIAAQQSRMQHQLRNVLRIASPPVRTPFVPKNIELK